MDATPMGRSLRLMLIGWRASLRALADEGGDDPAQAAVAELLRQVEALLETGEPGALATG